MNQEIVTFWARSDSISEACEGVQSDVNEWLSEKHPVKIIQMDVHHLRVDGDFLAVITLLVRHAPFGEE